MTDRDLPERVGRRAGEAPLAQKDAQRIAALIRHHTGRRWAVVYSLAGGEVLDLAWSGPTAVYAPSARQAQG